MFTPSSFLFSGALSIAHPIVGTFQIPELTGGQYSKMADLLQPEDFLVTGNEDVRAAIESRGHNSDVSRITERQRCERKRIRHDRVLPQEPDEVIDQTRWGAKFIAKNTSDLFNKVIGNDQIMGSDYGAKKIRTKSTSGSSARDHVGVEKNSHD
jgi:hypothetical protein